jgi:putative N6-adenine-specific DNA methylase
MENQVKFELIAKTFFGLEEALSSELIQLGAEEVKTGNRAVSFMADKEMLYRANYQLRTCISILKPLFSFSAINEDELYKNVFNFDWEKIFGIKQSFAIEATVYSTFFKHSQYAVLKTKDAIADYFRGKTKQRPDVDTENPDILINLHIAEDKCTISINSSGEPLFKRGYRIAPHEAPLNEVLAAGLISISGWKPGQHFIDFMCGSGTLLIEAALMANKIYPGVFRKEFGFEKWPDFDDVIYRKINTGRFPENDGAPGSRFIGIDISERAISFAQKNVTSAFLQKSIELDVANFNSFSPPVTSGIVIANPPYGERLKEDDIIEFYKSIGNTLKQNYKNFEAWILSSNINAMKFIGLHPSKKIKIKNAALDCTFNKYMIYEGSKKS